MLSVRPIGGALLVGVAAAIFAAACGSTTPTPGSPVGSGQLPGAGATFPEPFYKKAFYTYSQKYPQVTVNYQAVGWGVGSQGLIKCTGDFGASDVPPRRAGRTPCHRSPPHLASSPSHTTCGV